jgi:hypothetical protein
MENKDTVIRLIIGTALIIVLTIVAIDKPNDMISLPPQNSCKEDSLQNVIIQMKIDFENNEDGWDNKEKRYEQTLFEYEYGLDHIKNYHPEAYKEFHRIIGHKQEFSHETERENKKRLKPYE